MGKLLHDAKGSTLVEATIVIPMFLLLILGIIDVTYMFYNWNLANKAAYVGARVAVVSNPVPPNITSNANYTATQLLNAGDPCFDAAGAPTGNCYSTVQVNCSSTSCVPNTYGFNGANFTTIFSAMQNVFPALNAANVQISYQTNGAGFVGQPGGLPMNVQVSIVGRTHQFYFIGPLMNVFGGGFANPAIPAFATTMQSEDTSTN